MNFNKIIVAERQRRKAAEAESHLLRAQLEALQLEVLKIGAITIPTPAPILTEIVSQLQHTEHQLEYQQDLVRQVIDTSPNLVYVEDELGRCVLANKSYIKLLRQQGEETLTETITEPRIRHYTPPIDVPESFEESFKLKDGRIVWYHTTKSPLVRNDGVRYLITFSSDVTELKQARQTAEESMRAKQVFMANMSHEIRTPLHGVMGLAELLKKESLSEEQTDYVDIILSTADNLLVVINDILDFAKIESRQLSLESIPFDVGETVLEVARSLAFKMDEQGLLLRIVGLEANLPQVLGDPFRLRQVLVNLLSNAIRFTPHGTITITVEAGQQNDLALPVTFTVADTGIGISPDNLGQVFHSFQQANSSIPRLYGGTGLGLSICKSIVELQGGSIGVVSKLGKGSCFHFTIPYVLSDKPLEKKSEVYLQIDLLKNLSILLVEDNAVNQLIAVSMLGQWQVNVDMAQNGEEALLKALQHKYDLILMDVQMPFLDGIEATAQLRAQAGPNQATPVIAITADAIRVNADSIHALGFTDYLIKPYHEATLYKLLAQAARGEHVDLPPPLVAPTTVAQELCYDFDIFGKLAENKEFIHQLLTLFVKHVPVQVQTLRDAIENEDWPVVLHEAHRLKTTFGNLHIEPETGHLKQIEALAALPSQKKVFRPLIEAVVKSTNLYCALFSKEIT
ncbi:MAG TPA: ATP-binding protein [Hymenobacter sp.]